MAYKVNISIIDIDKNFKRCTFSILVKSNKSYSNFIIVGAILQFGVGKYSSNCPYCIVNYCKLLYLIVSYCILLYLIVFYCKLLYFIVIIVFYCNYCILLYFIVNYCIIVYYYIILYYIKHLYHTIRYINICCIF
jgi:hypothetical protein